MASKPTFHVPSGETAHVSIIETGMRMKDITFGFLLAPPVAGLDTITIPGWSFLIQSSNGEKALFDLCFNPDRHTYPPGTWDFIKAAGSEITGTKHVADVLKINNVDPAEISSVIWSHHHWDHIGDPTTFPITTEVVVGPGFKQAFLPGYPTQKDSYIEERFFEGRTLREIDFSTSSLKVGRFRALDFFGDGSFFLLDAPGHDWGHLNGLVRTTSNPDTFIFLGGDTVHHGGEIRPSPYIPLPNEVHFPLPGHILEQVDSVCPTGSQFRDLNVKRGRKPNQPFLDPVLVVDMADAVDSINKAQDADAQSNIFFIFAHDASIQGVVDFFPLSANEWKEKGWKEQHQWRFLADFTPALTS
ncbi:beta-lactamase-like protein [Xylaria curta]|nr:beta-lactamase-like protein [Xylaria curta]